GGRDGEGAREPTPGVGGGRARARAAGHLVAGARARRAPRRDPRGASDHRVAGHRPAPRPETRPHASGTSPALPCLTEQTPNPAGQEERPMQTRPIALMLLVSLTAQAALPAP